MTRHFSSKKLVGFSIFTTLLLFAFSGSHPTTISGGYTGAPNDNVCTTCHTPGGSLDGTIEISGLPGSVEANTTYPLTVTITNTAGSAAEAGFQMVSLKANLANGGTFSVPATENNAQVKTAAGKSYVGHQPSKNFAGNVVTFDVEWTAPASATGDLTVYAATIIANGANGNSGDKFVATNVSTTLGGGGDPLTGTFSNIVDASCSDTNDGSATINAMGGSGNYMYEWDNGETNATAVMLTGGDHNVTVTDDSNEQIVETVTIGAPPELIPSIIFQNDAICNGELSGAAELTANGGTPGYFYDWGNGITGDIQNNLAAGIYIVTVSDQNDCTALINVIIGQPDPIVINIILLDEPTCNGDDDGTISVEATGGNGNFSYNWLDAIGVPNGGTLSLIPMGDYQVEVIDGEGCINQTTITLGEPDAVTSTIDGTDVLCFGGNDGTVTVQGTGGIGGFIYEWSNGGIGATQTELVAGTYFVTVSDSDGCTSVNSFEIFEPNTAVEAGITVIDQPNCGNQDGELSAFGTGGNPDYTYLWSTGANNAVLSNIGSGEYTVTVIDQNNCASESTVMLQDNDGVTLAANNVANNMCFADSTGTVTISASGGSGNYTYSWSNGGTNSTENNLPAGEYTITVTDDGNCTGEITIEITEPNAFTANEILNDVTCNDAENGSIQLNATGGTGTLTYLWNIGDTLDGIFNLVPGIFSVTITDSLNCSGEIEFVINEPDPIITGDIDTNIPSCPGEMNGSITIDPSGGTGNLAYLWSTGDTTTTADNIAAGDYSVSISDENDCEVVFDFTLDDPTALSASATTTSPTCSDSQDGSATLALIGGSGNYSILWSAGDTTLTINSLTAGTYTATVTDGNGCTTEATAEIIAPPAIDPNITSTNETSNGASDGTAMADPQNGVEPYSFNWSTGDTTQSLQNLSPGSYDLTITDANNCVVTGSAIVNNGDCDISSILDVRSISCFGLGDGSISIELIGAVSPVTYEWNNGSTDENLANLEAGEYDVTITDANNCQLQILDLEITEPDDIIASDAVITDASTSTSNDGSIDVEFSGGTGELQFDYIDENGNPIELASLEELVTGSYSVVVTDENDCIKTFGPYVVGVISGINELDKIIANIYPNPARSFFTIETKSKLQSNPIIYNTSGQSVRTTVEHVSDEFSIDVDHLPNGVYYVKLISESDILLKKIIIAK